MPSTYTTSLRLTLPATGELAGTWGTTVNAGVTSLAEAAIAGTAAVTMIDADYTLTAVNGSADQARNMFVTLTGTLSAARNVICPPVSKLYFVTNNTTGGYAITFKTLAGTGISVPNGQRAVVYCNGTDVLGGLTALDSLSLNGSLTLVGGTANTVPYLNGSKVVTTGAALAFDGANLSLGAAPSAWGAGIRGYEVPAGSVWSVSPTSIFLTSNAYYNGTNYVYKTSNASSQYQQGAGAHTWYVAASGTAGNTFTFTTAMTLNASGNLGVGTASPNARFTAGGNSSANTVADIQITRSSSGTTIQTGPNITFGDGTTNNTVALQATQGRFGVWNYGGGSWNERLSIDASGNVGLKVTPSAWSSVNYALQGTGGALFSTGANNILVGSNVYYDGAYKYVGAFNATLAAQSAGQHQWLTAAVGTAGAAISWTTAMTLDASGNLGLGGTPSAWNTSFKALEYSAGYVAAISTNELDIGQNNFYSASLGTWTYKNTAGATQYRQTGSEHRWYTAPSGTAGNPITFTQAMTLDASGNLGLGRPTNANYRTIIRGIGTTSATSGLVVENSVGTEYFNLNDAGNLGLGVTPSAWISNTKAAQIGSFLSAWTGSNGSANISFAAYEGVAINSYRYLTTGDAPTMYSQLTGAHRWYTAPSGTAGNAITFTQAMTLTANGNQLIGTTTENGNRLAVSGGTNGMVTDFINTNVNGAYIGITQSGVQNWAVGQPAGVDALVFTTGRNTAAAGTERMRLDASGNLGIGTASPDVFSRGDTRTVGVNSSGTSSIGINAATGNAASLYVGVNGTRSGQIVGSSAGLEVIAGSGLPLSLGANFSTRVTISSAGNVGVGTASPTSTLHVSGSFSRGVPVTKTSNFTLTDTENWVIVNNSTSSVTATLPAPSSFPGRELMFVARYATGGGNLVSASSNVVQPDGTVTNVIIPYDVSGRYKFSTIVSDGTNWVVMNRGIM